MRHLTLGILALGWATVASPIAATAAPAAFVTRVVDGNSVGVTVSNYGVVGNNFVNRSPSMEYPLGTGYEHLPHGGLWIGAQTIDGTGAFTGVTTGMVDSNQGTAMTGFTEFTAAGNLKVRSTDPLSAFYSFDAVSPLDVIAEFDDASPKFTQNNPEVHRPLGIQVQQRVYVWPNGLLDNVLFLRVAIRPTLPLTNAWVGWYTEFASGPKNAYAVWPPSGPAPPGSWYGKKLLQYDAAQRLLREHRCDGLPIPDNCHFEITPYWAGLTLLTPPAAGQHITVAAWPWAVNSGLRDTDDERFAILSAGTVADLTQPNLQPTQGDPVELIAIGPFSALPGDSIVVDFALVGGDDESAIQLHAEAAYQMYAAGYTDPAVPVALSLVRAEPGLGAVRLEWFTPEQGVVAMVERREGDGPWSTRGTAAAEASGVIRFVDRDVRAGARYGYRIAIERDGGVVRSDEALVTVPAAAALAVRPLATPVTSGAIDVEVSLPGAESARVELVDLQGRRLARRTIDPGAATQVVRLGSAANLAPGVYGVRLVQGSRMAVEHVIVIR